ncbi:hypothetical protein D3C75_1223200 [compost metagenome]
MNNACTNSRVMVSIPLALGSLENCLDCRLYNASTLLWSMTLKVRWVCTNCIKRSSELRNRL